MQISFVMLIFLLFLDQISGGQKSLRGQTALGGGGAPPAPLCGRKPVWGISELGGRHTAPVTDSLTIYLSVFSLAFFHGRRPPPHEAVSAPKKHGPKATEKLA